MTIDKFGDDSTVVKVFNPQTQTVIGTYDNYQQAGNNLHILPRDVMRHCGSKKRIYSSRHNMEVAVRLSVRDI